MLSGRLTGIHGVTGQPQWADVSVCKWGTFDKESFCASVATDLDCCRSGLYTLC